MAMSLFRVQQGGTGTATQFTPGSVVFVTTNGVYTQDNANFFWNLASHWLGLGTASPIVKLTIVGGSGEGNVAVMATNDYVSNTSGTLFLFGFGASSGNTYCSMSANTTGGAATGALCLNPGGGNVGIGTTAPTSPLQVVTLPTYATNALAIAGGLTAGAFFKVNVAGEYQVHVVV